MFRISFSVSSSMNTNNNYRWRMGKGVTGRASGLRARQRRIWTDRWRWRWWYWRNVGRGRVTWGSKVVRVSCRIVLPVTPHQPGRSLHSSWCLFFFKFFFYLNYFETIIRFLLQTKSSMYAIRFVCLCPSKAIPLPRKVVPVAAAN